MKQLVEKRKELEAKQAFLAKAFAEGKDTKDGKAVLDLEKVKSLGENLSTGEKAEKIRALNEELTGIGKELESLILVEKAEKDQADRDRMLNEKAGIVHPGSNGNGNGNNGGQQRRKTLGQLFVESPTFKQYNASERRAPVTEIKLDDIGMEIKTLLTETGFPVQSVRGDTPLGPVVPGALRRPVVADLIPQGTTGQPAIKYMEETTTTNSAATVTEGNAKPESALAFTERTSSVRKIATVLPVTDELFEDVPAMRTYVEARMSIFLQLVEENQLVRGDGNAPNLTGILNVGSIQTQAKGADPTPDAIFKAMQKIRTSSFLEPSGVIIHPDDWTDIRLLRTADGIYIWGSPADPGPERIWGLPVVVTTAMTTDGTTTGTAIVAAFDTAMMIWRRNQVAFAVSDQNEDFFIKNKLMLRIEERLAFAVIRPSAVCTVTGI